MTRERVVEAAVELADADGLDAVSMRSVAGRLGVVPMALYRHVRNKEDLVGAMVDELIGRYDPAGSQGEWQAEVRGRVLSARRVLLQHPWARRAIESRATRTPAVLGHMDSLAGAFIRGGISPDLTHHAMHALGHRIWGFSPEAFDDPDAVVPPEDPAELAALASRMAEEYPAIVAIATGSPCDEDFEFEFALDLILDGVARLHDRGWRS
ncbi:TetR/AcrR family transcriptional regulator C-terminal domain-containing protein [Tessaracoccus lubricantis]|uniref:TetR/AcrR family transcriptional regulator C-terminal domain-containing protein n=1 Tax=Tessaracoccus lubricantis TaxID=545543 RepID=A0ABP9F152_9ACTN